MRLARFRFKSVLSRTTVGVVLALWGSLAAAGPFPFTRVVHPDTNTVQLEIALRSYHIPERNEGPRIWLAAVSHIGETNYYGALQSFLDDQPLVLFEGIGRTQDFKRRSRALRAGRSGSAGSDEAEGLQATLAASLGLAFQLDAIDYDRPHFRNSDLSMEQLQQFMARQMEEAAPSQDGLPNPAFLALMQAMDGTSWMGALIHVGVKLLGASPKLTAMARLMFIEILGQLKGDLGQIQGVPPDWQHLIQVLIQERNKVVIGDLKSLLGRTHPPASVAVLYGAGHMDDMERRLISELGCRPAESRWLTAISVQPARAGLTEPEVATIRSLIEWQMKALEEEQGAPSSSPE